MICCPEVLMLPYLFVLLAIAVRFLPFVGPLNFLPHAWHFTPVAASLLFFGARGSRRQMWIPLVLFCRDRCCSDEVHLLLYFVLGPSGHLGLVCGDSLAGNQSSREDRASPRIGAALSQFSFVLPDQQFRGLGRIAGDVSANVRRLMMSYTAGLPFFRGTVESDLFFSIAMFGTPVFLLALSRWMHKTSGNHIAAA